MGRPTDAMYRAAEVEWDRTNDAPPGARLRMAVDAALDAKPVPAGGEEREARDEIERLREGLERACDVSFAVGLLRLRARDHHDDELAAWGEKLKAHLVAIREVLSPGTEAFMAEQRAQESALAAPSIADERKTDDPA